MYRRFLVVLALLTLTFSSRAAEPTVAFDFTRPDAARDWHAAHDLDAPRPTPEGLLLPITGHDPYLVGPPRDYPEGQPLWLELRLRADRAGSLQVFYFRTGPKEEDSAREHVPGGKWVDVQLPLPALGKGYRLRIDPPGTDGTVTIARVAFSPRAKLAAPVWPAVRFDPIDGDAAVTSGGLRVRPSQTRFNDFEVWSDNELLARGAGPLPIGYAADTEQRWLVPSAAKVRSEAVTDGPQSTLRVTATLTDADGGTWTLTQHFRPGARPNTIDVDATVACSADRQLAFAAPLLLSAGAGAGGFGTRKFQALFPGLEYLDRDEPSSSEADLAGPQAKRQVPDNLKVTVPMMTVVTPAADATARRHLTLAWRMLDDQTAVPLFDSPDRTLKTPGHLMGLVLPGADGRNREPGALMPYRPGKLTANQPLVLRAMLLASPAPSAVEAVKQFVALRGLPPLPRAPGDFPHYVRQAAAGWLESKARETTPAGEQFRHAYPGQFTPHPAADAAVYAAYLATRSEDAALAGRLRDLSAKAIAGVKPGSYNAAGVSHVRPPLAALVFGHVPENVAAARNAARGTLRNYAPDGILRYRPRKDGPDYGKTHFADHANGLTAATVASLLRHATYCGDPDLIGQAIARLRALDMYDNTVPRGAQTWEMPLHTPDILASAHLVELYATGYEVTGDAAMLERARYWAWTGVPFLYLRDPLAPRHEYEDGRWKGEDGIGAPGTTPPPSLPPKPGPYAVIAVLGATHWQAPNWMGLPVQWCGLVYADALYRLARLDPAREAPWKTLADGIVISGIQQSWPADDPDVSRRGLLPDSVGLRAGTRNDPAINPGTVQANAPRAFGQTPHYDFHYFRTAKVALHAPGRIDNAAESDGTLRFKITPWPKERSYVLLANTPRPPKVTINGQPAPEVEHTPAENCTTIPLTGQAAIEVRTP